MTFAFELAIAQLYLARAFNRFLLAAAAYALALWCIYNLRRSDCET